MRPHADSPPATIPGRNQRGRTRKINAFLIRDNAAILFLRQRSGKYIETVIDIGDLARVISHRYLWFPNWNRHSRQYVAYSSVRVNGEWKKIALHRFLVNAPSGSVVDHINHDTLCNLQQNLRIVSNAENCFHRGGAQTNNRTSGIRGVSWNKSRGKWESKVTRLGKNHFLGYYDTIEAAAAAARAKILELGGLVHDA